MRIVIMGTGPFALPAAEDLRLAGHEIALVVTRPVAIAPPKKRPPRPVYDWAREHGLEVYEPASINQETAVERLREAKADLLFVCDYGQILGSAALSTSRLGGINLHGSLLPRHRGAAPVQWALLRGDRETGVTVIHMTPRLDAGPALAVRRTEILPGETAEQLEPRLADFGVDATREAVEKLTAWDGVSPLGQHQDRSLVTRAPRFQKSDGQLDFRLPAEYLQRLVRACQPWPGTFAQLQLTAGKSIRIIVRSARALVDRPAGFPSQPGAVQACDSTSISGAQVTTATGAGSNTPLGVVTGSGVLLIERMQPAGKREMEAGEFLRGHQLDPASRFTLPEPPLLPLDAER